MVMDHEAQGAMVVRVAHLPPNSSAVPSASADNDRGVSGCQLWGTGYSCPQL